MAGGRGHWWSHGLGVRAHVTTNMKVLSLTFPGLFVLAAQPRPWSSSRSLANMSVPNWW